MKVLSAEKNFLAIEKEFSSYNNSEIVILQAPLEKTVCYGKGTRFGPKEILKASHYVEYFDEELRREICFEKGICTLEEIRLGNLSVKGCLSKIYNEVKKHIDAGKFVVTFGGEHSISLATIKAHFEKYSNMSVLQIDAHSDLRESYNDNKYSHASVMARVAEFTKDIVQVGIRAQSKEEYDFILRNRIKSFYSREIRNGLYGKHWIKKVSDSLRQNVYITFDVDGLDASVLPATGTPDPGGLYWDETLDLIKLIGRYKKIIGFDIVELAPKPNDIPSNFIAAKLAYKILNYSYQ